MRDLPFKVRKLGFPPLSFGRMTLYLYLKLITMTLNPFQPSTIHSKSKLRLMADPQRSAFLPAYGNQYQNIQINERAHLGNTYYTSLLTLEYSNELLVL
jgi:hypothetical protein